MNIISCMNNITKNDIFFICFLFVKKPVKIYLAYNNKTYLSQILIYNIITKKTHDISRISNIPTDELRIGQLWQDILMRGC